MDSRDGRVIGSSRFHGYDPDRSEVEIGWTFLARSRWGGVYNGEMKRLMLRHAFRFVNSVIFAVGRANVGSQKAVEKIGGVWRGIEGGRQRPRESCLPNHLNDGRRSRTRLRD